MAHSTVEVVATAHLDLSRVRAQFPSLLLEVNGQAAAFLDGPGGTQVPQRVIDAISEYLRTSNANTCGAYATSRRTDQMIANARSSMADFLGCDWDEIVFGPNMTSLTYAISRAVGRELGPGDEIALTHLDHDANISPWRALEERSVKIQMVEIHEQDCTLDMDDLAHKITPRTKVVAAGYASNAVGTINDVKTVVRLAHEAGAMAFIDAVHYAPHGPIDVRELDCDFLACSTYKFFGPHMGVLYGKREHLARLQPYKLRANTNAVPQRWEWGTLNHELLAGVTACVEYLADLGKSSSCVGTGALTRPAERRSASNAAHTHTSNGQLQESGRVGTGVHTRPAELCSAENMFAPLIRRDAILAAYRAIRAHERQLMQRMLNGLAEIPGLRLYGISDPARLDCRCPTFAIRIPGHTPLGLATKLGQHRIFTWDGNYYALNLTERLGVEPDGGFLRIGFVHYNTEEEVDRVLEALQRIAS
jgi:cysteine desulfurase family protein (TIGR01976 family)